MKRLTWLTVLGICVLFAAVLNAAPQGKGGNRAAVKAARQAQPRQTKQKSAAGQAAGQGRAGRDVLSADQLPAAVSQSVQAAYPQGTILKALRVTKGAAVRYDVAVKNRKGARAALVVSADGQILKSQKRKAG